MESETTIRSRQMLERTTAALRSKSLNAKRANETLGLASIYGLILSINHTGQYNDAEFEQQIVDRVFPYLAGTEREVQQEPIDVLHVITDAYDHGGHTPLLEHSLHAREKNERAAVCVVRSATFRFSEEIKQSAVQLNTLTGSMLSRLSQLIALGRNVRTIVLYISPEDIVSAIAGHILRAEGKRILFVNHADHLFSFGRTAADVILEISSFGWKLDSYHLPDVVQSFLGIPHNTQSRASVTTKTSLKLDEYILSVGSPWKYEPFREYDFCFFLNKLVRAVPHKIVIIGPDGTEPWWMKLNPEAINRVEFRGIQHAHQVREAMANAACYVDSFPTSGGTAFPQAILTGVASHGLISPCQGYSYADAVRSETLADLISSITKSVTEGGGEQQAEVRSTISENQNIGVFSSFFDRAIRGDRIDLPRALDSSWLNLKFFEECWQEKNTFAIAIPPWADAPLHCRILLVVYAILGRSTKLKQGRRSLLAWLFHV